MNPTETAFLVTGLALGTALGAALWQAVRSMTAPQREVRLTVAPNSVPARRAATLAAPGGRRDPGPLAGSPDGDAHADFLEPASRPAPAISSPALGPAWSGGLPVRTPVPNARPVIPGDAIAIPVVIDREPDAALAGVRAADHARTLAVAAVRTGGATVSDGTTGSGGPPATTALALAEAPVAIAGDTGQPVDPDRSDAVGQPVADACADERRLVDERCAVATAAREEARRTADALRDTQRAYDALQERVARAQEVADPRRVADAKAHLHAAFRTANDAAASPEDAETAAREWLDAVNHLNAAVRDAARLAELGGTELRAQLPALERLGLEADAARIAADNAAEACQVAREGLAACEEAATRAEADATPAREPEPEDPFAGVWPAGEPDLVPEPASPGDGGVSSIILVLRGDRETRERIVTAVAGTDPEGQREWHLRIADLVDAITARAIEDGYLDVPADDPFWGLFEPREARDIVGALSALGFRYDGMGGFADDRVPAARDLSLAVGYAGLDRMRIRSWPREDTLTDLYARVTVAADEWLADAAGDLTLGRMVDALGSRAAALADTWNAWGRVRPVLLAE